MDGKKIKNIVATLVTSGMIVGGLVVGFKDQPEPPEPPTPLTWEEYTTLVELYNEELRQVGSVQLDKVANTKDLYQKLHTKLLERDVTVTTTLEGTKISPEDYKILRSGLFKKMESHL